MTRRFRHVVAIDWSGQAVARPRGLAVALASRGDAAPVLLEQAGGWSRESILDGLLAYADARADVLIGVDLSPGFPFVDAGAYFPGGHPPLDDARALWRFVDEACAGDEHLSVGTLLRDAGIARHFRQQHATGDLFPAGSGRLRVTERAQRAMRLSPSSCFNLIGAAQVGKSSLTGMRVLHRLGGRIPVWPFDPVPADGPLIVEIYTSIAARAAGLPAGRSKMRDAAALDAALAALGSRPHAPLARYDDHATDAILTAAWLRGAAADAALWSPPALTPAIARTEGWTFGVP